MKNKKWAIAWLLQALAMAVLSVLTAFGQLMGGFVSALLLWAIFPVCGLFSAYKVTLKGLNNYLAWILPPVCLTVGYLLVYSFMPHFSAVLLSAFLAIVGAAAGEVRKREK